MPDLILYSFLIFAFWMIKRDTARRVGISPAIWIPTIWVGILSSRPVSAWIGFGGSSDTLDGSPLDRVFYLSLILAGLVVLFRRAIDWGWLAVRNWPIILFYGFLLASVLWANSPVASFKRWFKETGNIVMALVILTDPVPLQAFRAVFVRCAIVLIPLSFIFVRYFPHIGRRYNSHNGQLEAIGVTFQKNSLGTMLLVCALVYVWDWQERRAEGVAASKGERLFALSLAAISIWLFLLCDSKTSMMSLAVATSIMLSIRLPVLRRRIGSIGTYSLAAAIGFFALDRVLGITEAIVTSLGRDMTFTGRTDVWRELLNVGTDPIIGTGFMSFWDDPRYQSRLPDWVAFSAHNGYIEVYLAGGLIGCITLALFLLGTAGRINRALKSGDNYSVVRFAILVAVLVANFFESNFACMTPLGLLFTLAALDVTSPFSHYGGFNSSPVVPREASSPFDKQAEARNKSPSEAPIP